MPYPASRGPGRPPAAKAADTRKRIVLAARDVFSERGYDAATFQAIALRADLTRPAINHYFSSKKVLYREVLAQTTEHIIEASIARAWGEATLSERLVGFLTAAIEADAVDRSAARFLVTSVLESQRHPDLGAEEEEYDPVLSIRRFLQGAIADAIESGELTADTDAESLVELLLAVVSGVGFYAGFVDSAREMAALLGQLRRLMAGVQRQPRR